MPHSPLRRRALVLAGVAIVAFSLAPPALAEDPTTPTDSSRFHLRTASQRTTTNVRRLTAEGAPEGPRRVAMPRLNPRAAATSPAAAPAAAPALAASSGGPAPGVATSFAGLKDADNDAYQGCGGLVPCVEPSDPHLAVGLGHVVQAVNSRFRITDRAGNELGNLTAAGFFGFDPAFNAVADPRVVYDAYHDRWLAIELSWTCAPAVGYIDLAISTTGDPTAPWKVWEIPFASSLPDYPGLGTSADKVVLSANNFLFDGTASICAGPGGLPESYQGASLVVIDWAELLSLPETLDLGIRAPDASYSTFRPAVATPARAGQNAVHVVGQLPSGPGTSNVVYTSVTGTVTPLTVAVSPIIDLTAAGVAGGFALAPPPTQPGSPATIVDAVDERPTDAIWQSDRLAFVSTSPCSFDGGVTSRDCVRVAELNTSTAPPTMAQDFLVGTTGYDSFMGGIGFSGGGDLHVVYSRSSASVPVATIAAYQRTLDPPESLSAEATLASADETYPGTRWGDYVGVAQDPIDSAAVWQGDQHPDAGSWVTQVTQLRTAGASYVPIAPARLLDTRTGNGLGGRFTANVPRTLPIANREGIPANAIAITGNVTVVNQRADGYISVTPAPTPTPSTSTLNFPLGDIRANNLTIPLSRTGSVGIVYKATDGRKSHVLLDVTGYFVYDDTKATYTAISPVRTLDSRNGTGVPARRFAHGKPRTWQVRAACAAAGVVGDATAVTGNVTVVDQTAGGYISITPTPPSGVPATSSINFPVGDIRANGIAVQLAPDGTLSATYRARAGQRTHILFDLTGCFVNTPGGAHWFPIDPVRRLDTRVAIGLAGRFASAAPRTLGLAPGSLLPSDTAAVTGNLTVVDQRRAGYVSMTTSAIVPPATSTLNFPVGDIRANGVTSPLAAGASTLVYMATGRTTDLLLDVTGYFR